MTAIIQMPSKIKSALVCYPDIKARTNEQIAKISNELPEAIDVRLKRSKNDPKTNGIYEAVAIISKCPA